MWKSTGNKNILTAQSEQHFYVNYLKLLYDIVLIFLSNLFLQLAMTIKDMLSGVGVFCVVVNTLTLHVKGGDQNLASGDNKLVYF